MPHHLLVDCQRQRRQSGGWLTAQAAAAKGRLAGCGHVCSAPARPTLQVIRDELRKKDNAVGGDVSDSSDGEAEEAEIQGSAPSITSQAGRWARFSPLAG